VLKKEKNKITKDTLVAEILKFSGVEEILTNYHFPCLDCPMASFELEMLKIGEVCKIYNIDLENLLQELNKDFKKEKILKKKRFSLRKKRFSLRKKRFSLRKIDSIS